MVSLLFTGHHVLSNKHEFCFFTKNQKFHKQRPHYEMKNNLKIISVKQQEKWWGEEIKSGKTKSLKIKINTKSVLRIYLKELTNFTKTKSLNIKTEDADARILEYGFLLWNCNYLNINNEKL